MPGGGSAINRSVSLRIRRGRAIVDVSSAASAQGTENRESLSWDVNCPLGSAVAGRWSSRVLPTGYAGADWWNNAAVRASWDYNLG